MRRVVNCQVVRGEGGTSSNSQEIARWEFVHFLFIAKGKCAAECFPSFSIAIACDETMQIRKGQRKTFWNISHHHVISYLLHCLAVFWLLRYQVLLDLHHLCRKTFKTSVPTFAVNICKNIWHIYWNQGKIWCECAGQLKCCLKICTYEKYLKRSAQEEFKGMFLKKQNIQNKQGARLTSPLNTPSSSSRRLASCW